MDKMDCEKIKEIIPAYIKHTALEEDAEKVEEHLCICHDCRQSLSQCIDKTPPSKVSGGSIPMDKPFAPSKEKKSIAQEEKISLWEYIVLSTGIIILGIIIYLFLKR
ncbi:MAG: zf-HC2 domain-containing protein [Candidatus Omnitrophica bacterium]|nr:zf-HC2 domain-containing protein [Candidatus Omnitrophota bacterium]MBU0896516.1 zf-HC2 domain-containing protein [Candidatus Omnitrophota bacterium]MBU1133475.1 zf-HC2 domain-containing protein [Candidatus Omnitrophota bacterium]MBU1811060.1 zf-HC2 domain-containing protein [Candidatus Omnitrophota bacterium]